MPLKLFVGITDRDWYELLRGLPGLDEVNFWAPGGTPFRALGPGEIFLFKLHAPSHFIVGGDVFAHDTPAAVLVGLGNLRASERRQQLHGDARKDS